MAFYQSPDIGKKTPVWCPMSIGETPDLEGGF